MREWLVIEKTTSRTVFGDRDAPKGYIPRDVVEGELGIRVEPDGRCSWFNNEQSALMRAHPEWRDTEPPGSDPRFAVECCELCGLPTHQNDTEKTENPLSPLSKP